MPVYFCRLHNRVQAGPAVKTLNSDDQEKHSPPPPSREPTSKCDFTRAIGVRRASRSFQPGIFFFTYSLLVRDVQLWLGVRLQPVLLKSGVDPSILHDLLQNKPRARVKIRIKTRGSEFLKDSE